MADKTYLQLINKVMVNLREDEVSVVVGGYTALIGAFVNQAKEMVEDSWQWHRRRLDLTFTTVVGQNDYDLTDIAVVTPSDGTSVWVDNRSHLIHDAYRRALVWDVTADDEYRLCKVGASEGKNTRKLNPDTNDTPDHFYMQGGTLSFVYAPTQARTITVHAYIPQDELDDKDTVVVVPWRPIVDYATYLGMDERGEELGNGIQTYEKAYERNIARAISNDTIDDENELILVVD